MKSIVYVVALFAALAMQALSQTAKVVVLTTDEADEAKALYAELAETQRKIDALRSQIDQKYLQEKDVCITSGLVAISCASGVAHTKDGWLTGFEFSDDFRAIVPKPWSWIPCFSMGNPIANSSTYYAPCSGITILGTGPSSILPYK